jgi:hypothetical protein
LRRIFGNSYPHPYSQDKEMKNTTKYAIAFLILITTDGFLTFWATNNGYTEVNPLMTYLAHTVLYPISKVLIPVIGVAFVSFLINRFPKFVKVANIGYVALIAMYVFVLGNNVLKMI